MSYGWKGSARSNLPKGDQNLIQNFDRALKFLEGIPIWNLLRLWVNLPGTAGRNPREGSYATILY